MIPTREDIGWDKLTDIWVRAGDKWTQRTVIALDDGPMRFNALRRHLEGISQRILTRTLRMLERDGLVQRTVVEDTLSHVEYELTALGRSALALNLHVKRWIIAHYDQVVAAREAFDTIHAAD